MKFGGTPASERDRRRSELRCGTALVSDGASKRVVQKTFEEWTYNFGPNRLMQVVVFENGKLIEVKSAGYGR